MNIKFIANDDNTINVSELLTEKGPFKFAVAFWGKRAIEMLSKVHCDVQIICNLESGATNPTTIKELKNKPNIQVRSCSNLHAKIYWTPSKVIITSANFSTNGLSYEDDELNGWIEAGVVIKDKSINSQTSEWFDRLWLTLKEVDEADIKIAMKRWKKSRENRLPMQGSNPPAKQSLFRALRESPQNFKDKKIYFVIWVHDADERDVKAVNTAIEKGLEGLHSKHIDWYVDFPGIPENAYLISFRLNSDEVTEIMLSKSLERHIYIKGYKNSKINIMPEVKSIEGTYILTPHDKKVIKKSAMSLWENAKGDGDGKIISLYESIKYLSLVDFTA